MRNGSPLRLALTSFALWVSVACLTCQDVPDTYLGLKIRITWAYGPGGLTSYMDLKATVPIE